MYLYLYLYSCVCNYYIVITFVSTLDIYNPNQVAKGMRHLQAALGLPQTGVMTSSLAQVIESSKGKCVGCKTIGGGDPGASCAFTFIYRDVEYRG